MGGGCMGGWSVGDWGEGGLEINKIKIQKQI